MSSTISDKVTEALMNLVTEIPDSDLNANTHPQARAQAIISRAAKKAAATSGTLALPPGPLGMLTIIPDLVVVWKIQQQMVADIAALYGKSATLNKQTMIYCLFKHSGAILASDIVVRVGGRYLVKRTTLRAIQSILQKVGIRVTQKVIGKGISRWIPLAGAAVIAGYAYYDTAKVGGTSVELFSNDLEIEK